MRHLLWAFKDHLHGDITLVQVGDEYHMFAELSMLKDGIGPRYVGHAVSRDLYTWEELPVVLECGPKGSFDGHWIFHMDLWIEKGIWYMFYTGLDINGPGQKQVIALATSNDGMTWTKHPANPILTADPRWYEQAIPPEATYQAKDGGRLWFRDPCIIRNEATNEYGMIVVARDASKHPDKRGCIAWAKSKDLYHWQAHPPLFSPDMYHTVETPSLFEHRGRHYLIYFSGRYWGTPFDSGDPWQDQGMYYAVSENGWEGPYKQFNKGLLLASSNTMRMGAARCLALEPDKHVFYGWLMSQSVDGDVPSGDHRTKVVPPPRNVKFEDDGQMKIVYRSQIEQFTSPAQGDLMKLIPETAAQWPGESPLQGKAFVGRGVALSQGRWSDGIVSVSLEFMDGLRAGLLLRAQGSNGPGLMVAYDRPQQRVELSLADTGQLIDARHWPRSEKINLRVVAIGPSIEVYANDQLLIHQARYREVTGQIGVFVEHAQAKFTNWTVRSGLTSQVV